MVTCAVPGCHSSKKENPHNYTFHVFPQDVTIKKKWLKMIDREGWVPKKYSTICSKHFAQICFFNRGTQRVRLSSGSIPTLFMPVALKPKRRVSSYVYRDISPVPCSSAANFSDLENSPWKKKMQKTIDVLRKRLDITKKKLKNLRAQQKRAIAKVVKFTEVDEDKLLSLQDNVGAVCNGVLFEQFINSSH